MKTNVKSVILALIAILCWSTMAAVFKKTLSVIDNDINTLLFFTVWVSLAGLTILHVFWGEKNRHHFNGRHLISSAVLGALNPFIYYLILFKAYSLLPGQEAGPLNYVWPIAMIILSVPLLGQRVRPIQYLAIGISFIGVLVISTRGQVLSFRFTHLPGAAMAVGSAFIMALFWILNVKDRRPVLPKMWLNFVFGALYITVWCLVSRAYIQLDLTAWPGFLWIGLFEMGITYVVWVKALSLSENNAFIGNLVYISPFLALIFLRLIVGEVILLSSVAGLALIVGGILLQSAGRKR